MKYQLLTKLAAAAGRILDRMAEHRRAMDLFEYNTHLSGYRHPLALNQRTPNRPSDTTGPKHKGDRPGVSGS